MNQKKTGEFLKQLRKEKGLTQEQLAEQFYVSGRTVSRWETGSNMPDLGILVELADFYDVDIREIIDGERKSEKMDIETKDTLKKVAEYTAEEKKNLKKRMAILMVGTAVLQVIAFLLYESGGFDGFFTEDVCSFFISFVYGGSFSILTLTALVLLGVLNLEPLCKLKRKLLGRKED